MSKSSFIRTSILIVCAWICTHPLQLHAQNKADFNTALKPILKLECGYAGKNARGGETYCGITRKTHSDWDGWPVIDKQHPKLKATLPELDQSVSTFYRTRYWDKIRGDEIISQKEANAFFKAAVMKGLDRAIMDEESAHGLKKTGTVSNELIAAINKKQ